MTTLPTMSAEPGQLQRQVLLNMKCLLWCLRQMSRQYSTNLAVHSLEAGELHADVQDSNLGDNLQFLIDTFGRADLDRIIDALGPMGGSQASVDIGGRHFEVGHYVQALKSFGPIAEESCGIISCITPELRGIFYLDGPHLMESAFAPSDVRVIFGTYIS